MKIRVTQEHIDRALAAPVNRAPCYVCPVAQALIDAGCREVSVGSHEANWISPDGREIYAAFLPDAAVDWIRAFDFDSADAEPFEFDLDVIEFEEGAL